MSVGLGHEASARLADAVASPGHPIVRTMADPVPSFNVLPTAPGGPALRTHLPLIVTRGGAGMVLGVLALAHDRRSSPRSGPCSRPAEILPPSRSTSTAGRRV